jgi:hypothetical protein
VVLPFHYHRHCTHMNFAAVLGLDVLQHWLSGQTDEGSTSIVSANAVHNSYSLHDVFRYSCD